jgi:hypothetical protein
MFNVHHHLRLTGGNRSTLIDHHTHHRVPALGRVAGCRNRSLTVTWATLSDELQRAYDAYEHQLSTAWRRDAGNDCAVPVSPRASGNDATPVGDIETAYRLYSEEISQAWKTPR